jgi:hypothetical protein
MTAMNGRHADRDKEVRKGAASELRGFIEDIRHPTRAELPAGLPVPSEPLEPNGDVLGEPLSIKEVAELIGCSPWTVRQRYVPIGLPHFRLGPNGKLIFYKNQIIRWLLTQQQKGGQVV